MSEAQQINAQRSTVGRQFFETTANVIAFLLPHRRLWLELSQLGSGGFADPPWRLRSIATTFGLGGLHSARR